MAHRKVRQVCPQAVKISESANFKDNLSTITIPTNDPKDYQLPLPVIARRKVMIAVTFFHQASCVNKGPINIMQLTKVMFDTYRTSDYDATEVVKPWNISPPETNSDLANWSKNARPQANNYKEFKDEAYWTRTKEKYVANLEACNLQHLIDDSHIVTNPDLDRSQTLWFFKVLQDKITCPAAKSIVQKHSILKNTRKLWEELCNHLDNSMNAVLRASKLSSYITSARLHSGTWRGTQTNFILHFKEQLRLYNEISDEPCTDKQLMNHTRTNKA